MNETNIELENLNPFEDVDAHFQQDQIKNKKQWYKKKLFIILTVFSSSLLFLLLLLRTHHTSSAEKTGYISQPKKDARIYSSGTSRSTTVSDYETEQFNNIAEIEPAEDGNDVTGWRLDTANNYTSNVQFWRDNYGKPQERHYYFNITILEKINANGAVRNLTVINGQYPGPLIEANSGDTIYLHVLNQMEEEPVSFHLHGLFYPNNTFDDGAASINVCPIAPGNNYTYKIPIGENEYGTYWYHSHWSTQYADGVYGPIMIHSPIEDANLTYYDSDMIFLLNDYYYVDADTLLKDYLTPANENTEPAPNAGLISGTYSQATNFLTPENITDIYRVGTYLDPYGSYRIRLANVGFFLPFKFSIDEHKLTLVEVEGTLIQPVESDYVDISVGERYSFFINRTNTEYDSYWMHARLNQFCLAADAPELSTDIMGIISYEDVYEIPETHQTWQYDGGSPKCLDFPQSELRTLNNQVPVNKNGSNRPDEYVELDVTFFQVGYQMTYGYFNEYTWKPFSNTSSMHELLFNKQFSNTSHVDNMQTFSENQYILNFDTRGMIVDLLINNFDDGAHPFHLHGYKFWVIGYSKSGSFYPNFYEKYSDRLDLTNPILRDTVSVPPFGFAVLRFVVDNPGVFPFHCHIGWHMEAGLLLQVNALQSEWSQQEYNPQWGSMCGYDFADPYLVETEKY